MTFRTVSFCLLSATLFLTATLAQATAEKCQPGFLWDEHDKLCTCDERR